VTSFFGGVEVKEGAEAPPTNRFGQVLFAFGVLADTNVFIIVSQCVVRAE